MVSTASNIHLPIINSINNNIESEEEIDDSDNDPNYFPSDSEGGSETADRSNLSGTNNNVSIDGLTDNNVQENTVQKKKSRKRLQHEDMWKATQRRKKVLAGEAHIAKNGKTIAAKRVKPPCNSCKKRCYEKINENMRSQIFKAYWDTSKNWDLKHQFILSHISSRPVIRRRPGNGSKEGQRQQSISYTLTANNECISVCKTFFLNTLGISDMVVRNVLKKQENGFVFKDMRGRHIPPNKISNNVLENIRSHIQSFPIYESHYSRNTTSRQFLGSDLSIRKMYKLYQEKCVQENFQKSEIGKYWLYRKIFNSEFNLSFKKPSNDNCDQCDMFVLKLKQVANDVEQRQVTQEEYDKHLNDADYRYAKKREDKKLKETKTRVIMLDLQKCLPTPYLKNCHSFYLLKLWTLNLTIYDATSNKSYCYVWDESQVGRGGHEISSALLKWTLSVLKDSDTEHLIIWSDNCPSQNRNIMMLVNYFYLLSVCPSLKSVTHKFLLRGHTHNEADHVHALIERSVKNQPPMEICTPWDWQQLIRTIGANVVQMKLEDFKNYEILYSGPTAVLMNRKQNEKKENFRISDVVWCEARADQPNILFYKTQFSDEGAYHSINLNRNIRKSQPLPHELPPIRKTPKGISKKKIDHLQTLLQWVPEQFHNFYKNLKVSEERENY